MRKLFTVFMALVLSLAYSSPVLAQSATPVAYSSLPTLTAGQATAPAVDLNNRLYTNTYVQPPQAGLTSVEPTANTAVGSSRAQGVGTNPNLYGINVVSGASAGYVLVFSGTSVPADGAVTPKLCYTLAANSTLDTRPQATFLSGGITVVFSTTGCYTKTASATAFISVTAQ